MVDLIIGDIDVSKYVNENYKVTRNTQNKKTFKNHDGSTVNVSSERTTTISAQLEDVPDDIAKSISVLTKSNVKLTYTAPEMLTGEFECTNYNAQVDNNDFEADNCVDTWYIDLTFSSLSEKSDSDGL
ncbi:MAG: hypothetical protein ACI4XF_01340 [Oscillospiraceae bacterium]